MKITIIPVIVVLNITTGILNIPLQQNVKYVIKKRKLSRNNENNVDTINDNDYYHDDNDNYVKNDN